ncbi:11057_t:CDS:2 [Funneliformis geosporum]|uniref:11057_t:CDS:1 n=1 Tax=Funneliformis geosporum TaxID=1117311 RepID=A0A9W4SSS6_9GLOM|nr:11057_t:CDS:2 [Funneliformis geosporum]
MRLKLKLKYYKIWDFHVYQYQEVKGSLVISETIKILYNSDKDSEVMRRANQASALQKLDDLPILTQASISFEIPNHFDVIIRISNIKTKPNRNFIRAELSALRPIYLPTAVKRYQKCDKIADYYAINASSAVETYIEAKYQRHLSAKYFSKILCSLVSSTEASLKIISAEDTIANRKIVSNIIKAVKENIKDSDVELIANIPDITLDNAEILKQIFTYSFNNNIILQQYYLWRSFL